MKKCSKCGVEKDESAFYPRRGDCKDCKKAHSSEHARVNVEKIQERRRAYYTTNREEVLRKRREYVRSNTDKIAEVQRNKYRTDPVFAAALNVRARLNSAMVRNGGVKQSKTGDILGCTFEQLIDYLGDRPVDSHLDHICPLSQGKTLDEIQKLCHYTNHRWLSAEENLKKSDNRTPEGEALCKKLLAREWID